MVGCMLIEAQTHELLEGYAVADLVLQLPVGIDPAPLLREETLSGASAEDRRRQERPSMNDTGENQSSANQVSLLMKANIALLHDIVGK